ncbi:MAG: hypothetical protein AB7P33_10370 [Dehalococcoidia bacterium]
MSNDTNRDEMKQKAEEMSAKAQATAEDIKEQAGAQADAMLDEADDRREKAAAGLDRGADEMHSRSDMAKDFGKQAGEQVAAAGHKVASGVETTAQYMHEQSTRDLAKTATKYAQEHPVQAGLGALLTLVVFWRLMK